MVPRWVWSLSPAIVMGTAFLLLARFIRQRAASIPVEVSVDRALTARAPTGLIDLSHAVDVQHWVLVVLVAVACLLLAGRSRQALLLLIAEPVAEGLNVALKIIIHRRFPDQGAVQGWEWFNALLFPSGHVVRATVTIGLLVVFVFWPNACLRWPTSIAALALIGLVAVTQVAVGGHLPLDVVGGFFLGGTLVNLIGVVTWAWVQRGSVPLQTRPARVLVTGPWQAPHTTSTPLSLPIRPGVSVRRGLYRSRWLRGIGLAVMLVTFVVGVRAPQHLWYLTAQPTTTTVWPRVLASEAVQGGAGSARNLLAQLHRWAVSS